MESIDEVLSKPAFDALGAERKEMFKGILQKIQGAGNMQALGIITDFMKNAPKGNELTEAEQDAMFEAFLETLPEKERAKYRVIGNMAKGFRRGQ